MADQLLARGDKVIATGRDPRSLAGLQQVHGERIDVLQLALIDASTIRAAINEAFRLNERIDVIVSNAGYGLFGAAEELTDAQIDRQIARDLSGSNHIIRAALPHLRRQGGGRILQLSSEGGQIAYPGFSLYHATKWGIEGFIEATAQEVRPFDTDFIIVEPGPTNTKFGKNIVFANASETYAQTPAGDVRSALKDGSFIIRGDASRTVSVIIAAANRVEAPLSLTLGSTAYYSVPQALSGRLTALQEQREVAGSADPWN